MATKKEQTEQKPADDVLDFTQDLGAGYEHVEQSDLGTPFMSILQKMSPEVDENEERYIEGAKAGDIILSTDKKVYGDKNTPVLFNPVSYIKSYVEWRPRESGGGVVANHAQSILTATTRNDKGQDVLENGNTIVTTAYVVGFAFDKTSSEWKPAIISFTSSQLKKARAWLNTMTSHKVDVGGTKKLLPMFSHIYKVSTQPESNEKGSWYGWKIECDSMLNDKSHLQTARAAHAEIAAGSMRMLAAPEETPF